MLLGVKQEKSPIRTKCNVKRVQHEICATRKGAIWKIAAWKIVTWKKCNMKKGQHKKRHDITRTQHEGKGNMKTV